MSFQNFDSFQNQHPAADAASAAPGAPAAADTTMTGQADTTPAPFQGPTPGEPSTAAVPQQGVEGKTTLWYVFTAIDDIYGPRSISPRGNRICRSYLLAAGMDCTDMW